MTTRTLSADSTTCPLCGGDLYLCEAVHTDGPGRRLHCRRYVAHNFPTDPGPDPSAPADVQPTASPIHTN